MRQGTKQKKKVIGAGVVTGFENRKGAAARVERRKTTRKGIDLRLASFASEPEFVATSVGGFCLPDHST